MKVTKRQSSIIKEHTTINLIPVGVPVWDAKGKQVIMKIKPTGFLLNSNIVADVSQRGDCFICSLSKGTIFAVDAGRPVIVIDSELNWNEQ